MRECSGGVSGAESRWLYLQGVLRMPFFFAASQFTPFLCYRAAIEEEVGVDDKFCGRQLGSASTQDHAPCSSILGVTPMLKLAIRRLLHQR